MLAVHPRALSRALVLSVLTLLVALLGGLGVASATPTTARAARSGNAAGTLAVSPRQQTVDYGQRLRFRAHLTDGSGPLADRRVQLVWQAGSTQHRAKSAWTDSDGNVSFRLRLYHTHTWRVVAPASPNSASPNSASPASGEVSSDSRHVRVRDFGETVVHEASRYRGAPYSYGGSGPHSFDCSGFTMFIWHKFGWHLPHSAAGQYHMHAMRHVSRHAKRPGDFIFMHSGSSIYHVGIYAGHGKFWAATHSGSTVRKESLWSSDYYVGRLPA